MNGPSSRDKQKPPSGRSAPPGKYDLLAKGPVRYLPVTSGGEVLGYLWASPTQRAASFVRRSEAGAQKSLQASVEWSKRLRQAWADGLTQLEALRRWIGEPEDPKAGGIAPDAEEQEAASQAELHELAWPGGDPLPESLGPQGVLPDGTPLSPRTRGDEKPGYKTTPGSAVRYVPVTRQGRLLGYLWASPTEDAAQYQYRKDAGVEGFLVGDRWKARLSQAKQEGLSPLEALRRWIGEPEDPKAGGIAPDAEEQEAPNLTALKEIAER